MAYIGNIPAVQYASFSKQTLTADSSTTSFTLDNAVANENELEVFVNNVRQEPGSGKAYTASGTTLTMSAAPTTGDSFYVIFQGKATQTVTPGSGTVTNAMLAGSITNEKLAGSIDLTTKVTGTLPLGNGGIGATTLAGAGITNTPSFAVKLSGNQTINNATSTKLQFATELWDTDSAFDNTTDYDFTVPAGQGGKYQFNFTTRLNAASSNRNAIDLFIDGSASVAFEITGNQYHTITGSVIFNLSAGQVVHAEMYQTSGGSIELRSAETYFSGFKLLGV